jgi:hypothetical protein
LEEEEHADDLGEEATAKEEGEEEEEGRMFHFQWIQRLRRRLAANAATTSTETYNWTWVCWD